MQAILLEVTLSIRNTDRTHAITVNVVGYYGTDGKLVKTYLERPLRIEPLASSEFVVEREDTRGGAGANFLVEWVSKEQASQPIIEAVMVGIGDEKSFAFVGHGYVIDEKP